MVDMVCVGVVCCLASLVNAQSILKQEAQSRAGSVELK